MAEDWLKETLDIMEKWEDEIKQKKNNMPKAKAAKKMKFLKSIGATSQLDKSTAGVNIEDENSHLTKMDEIIHMMAYITKTPLPFDDSIVVTGFTKIKRPEFDLKTYISCVKNLYGDPFILSEQLCYILSHARDFTVPRNNLFTFYDTGTEEIKIAPTEVTLTVSSPSPFTAKLMSLMDDLLMKYSEAKYQQLNLNVTYMVLFMTRQIFKGRSHYIHALKRRNTHEDYVKLCPKPVGQRLPDDEPVVSNEVLHTGNMLFTLILYAYLKSSRLTQRVLVATCISQMEYIGLGLPMMFDKLVQLYQVPEACLWDALCYGDEYKSMFTLADFHDVQCKGEAEVPPKSYTLFPYCRVLNGQYHSDLSCKNNKTVCCAMAFLIDKKIGMDNSDFRKAHWLKEIENTSVYKKGEALASEVFEKIKVYSVLQGQD